jgi:hypothetical protein
MYRADPPRGGELDAVLQRCAKRDVAAGEGIIEVQPLGDTDRRFGTNGCGLRRLQAAETPVPPSPAGVDLPRLSSA